MAACTLSLGDGETGTRCEGAGRGATGYASIHGVKYNTFGTLQWRHVTPFLWCYQEAIPDGTSDGLFVKGALGIRIQCCIYWQCRSGKVSSVSSRPADVLAQALKNGVK